MKIKVEVYCPKCNSTEVEYKDVTDIITRRISMNDLPKLDVTKSVDLLPTRTVFREMEAICKGCGHTVRFYSM